MKNKNYWLFGASIFLLLCSIVLNISHIVITNEALVLTFVGILATFIVVGNYAQVVEIRNSTQASIDENNRKTQEKIDESKSLFIDIQKKTKKLEQLENELKILSGEASRLFGLLAYDKEVYRASAAHLIDAIKKYQDANFDDSIVISLQTLIVHSLDEKNWNKSNSFFNYDNAISCVKKFSDNLEHKKEILETLIRYKDEESQKNEDDSK